MATTLLTTYCCEIQSTAPRSIGSSELLTSKPNNQDQTSSDHQPSKDTHLHIHVHDYRGHLPHAGLDPSRSSTGVVWCTERASEFGYLEEPERWANLGQGAPEVSSAQQQYRQGQQVQSKRPG